MKKKSFKTGFAKEGLKISEKFFCFKSNGAIYKIDWCVSSESGTSVSYKSNQNTGQYKK
ncbi:MAG: hypothetical protein HY959_02845 [Ignavibacteriae bacterium]|nr:hypothetical protein [Ignavibacteriota bacterium]